MRREYYVMVNGSDEGEGSREHPFRTISKAACTALAGDTITVHEGEYREWVKPQNGGTGPTERIVYQAAEGEHVVIKGSERISCWENVEGTVWKAVLPDSFFGEYNPYKEILGGDWFEFPKDTLHTGEVYLNGKSFYEAKSLEEVRNPQKRLTGYGRMWPQYAEPIPHPEDTLYQWYTQAEGKCTAIYANFRGADPNKELTEINVRRSCFYPDRSGINYITVRGFEMAQAACNWAPPTADQTGLLGANWSRGWVIENNRIHDAKCSAVSIGKDKTTGQNQSTRIKDKPGYQYQWEAVCQGLQRGWSRELVGSHVIRGNEIYDCGQNGIVGHMGCVFSRIYDNHIYNIAVKHEFFGYEIAGIKLHAAIDVQIVHNRIHDCTLGTWLDWQAQGTRVSRNLYYENDRDWMIEVTHGPCLVDNNIFASAYSIDNYAQGTAFVHNLQCGMMHKEDVLNRATPYHFPHTTQLAGAAVVYGGDDRFYQNIFVGGAKLPYQVSVFSGLTGYEGAPADLDEYVEWVEKDGCGDLEKHLHTKQPVYADGNVYLGGAESLRLEKSQLCDDADPQVRIVTQGEEVYLEMTAPKGIVQMASALIDTQKLGKARIVEEAYVTLEDEPVIIDHDLAGEPRKIRPTAGPLEGLKDGFNRIKIWG